MKKEIKVCSICNIEITKTDNFIELIDYKKGLMFLKCYYHTDCFNSQIKGKNPQQKAMALLKAKSFNVLDKTEKMLDDG